MGRTYSTNDGRRDLQKHVVLFQNKINLRYCASGWFYYRNILRCTDLQTSNLSRNKLAVALRMPRRPALKICFIFMQLEHRQCCFMYLQSCNIFPIISASQTGRKVLAADTRQLKFVSLATK
jgi:hypothetical protein